MMTKGQKEKVGLCSDLGNFSAQTFCHCENRKAIRGNPQKNQKQIKKNKSSLRKNEHSEFLWQSNYFLDCFGLKPSQ